MWLALWCGSKRLPGTSTGVAMTQRLEGSRFATWLALQCGSKRLPGTSAGVAMTQALGGEPLCNVVSSAAWQQAAPGNVCRCYNGPASGGEPLCNVFSSAVWQQAAPGNVCRCYNDPACTPFRVFDRLTKYNNSIVLSCDISGPSTPTTFNPVRSRERDLALNRLHQEPKKNFGA
jgi:hypothetical protein